MNGDKSGLLFGLQELRPQSNLEIGLAGAQIQLTCSGELARQGKQHAVLGPLRFTLRPCYLALFYLYSAT